MGEETNENAVDEQSLAKTEEKKKGKKSEMEEWINSFFIALIAALIIRIFILAPTIVKGPSMDPTLHDGNRLITERVSYFLNIKPSRGDVVTFTEPHSLFYTQTNPVNKVFYFFQKKDYIKRVIGIEGDHVEIKADNIIFDGEVFSDYEIKGNKLFIAGKEITDNHSAWMENASLFVNGQKLDEAYTNGPWSVNIMIENGKIVQSEYTKDKDVNLDLTVEKGYIFVLGDNRDKSSDSRKFSKETGDIVTKNGCISLKEISGRVLFRFWPLDKFGKLNK